MPKTAPAWGAPRPSNLLGGGLLPRWGGWGSGKQTTIYVCRERGLRQINDDRWIQFEQAEAERVGSAIQRRAENLSGFAGPFFPIVQFVRKGE